MSEDEGGSVVAPTTFVLTIGVESPPFRVPEGPCEELQRILAKVSEQLESYPLIQESVIRDSLGNAVGIWGFETPRAWRPNVPREGNDG